MSAIKDGGPAFPCWEMGGQGAEPTSFGLSLRDYFAAAALPAIIATYVEANGRCIGTEHFPRNVPHIAYSMADAMLRARGEQ